MYGDKVRVKTNLSIYKKYNGASFVKPMEEYKGKTFIIDSYGSNLDGNTYYRLHGISWHWYDDMLELAETEKVTKPSDLKDGDIVTLRNGDRLIYAVEEDEFIDLNESHYNEVCDLDDFEDDLTYVDSDEKGNDIVKVERPVKYEVVYDRSTITKKMTVAEICKELGYDVEIIKEDN